MIALNELSKYIPGIYFWKKNIDSVFIDASPECANILFGIKRQKDVIGRSDAQLPCKLSEYAEEFQLQDRQVELTNKAIKTIGLHHCAHDRLRVLLSVKSPFYDKSNNVIGTFGYCIDTAEMFSDINNLFTKHVYQPGFKSDSNKKNIIYTIGQPEINIKLTVRQLECLFFLIRGRKIKEIARSLNISPRTVEGYVDLIKIKFACQTRSSLIAKAIEQGFMNVLPESFLSKKSSFLIE